MSVGRPKEPLPLKAPPIKKVYCSECMYFCFSKGNTLNEECHAPQNVADTYFAPKRKCLVMPIILNTNNGCRWFREIDTEYKP